MKFAVGITGGSGVIIAKRLIEWLTEAGHLVELCRSGAGRMVIRDELSKDCDAADPLLEGIDRERVREWKPQDYGAPFASGSSDTAGMVIVPCSMATIGAVAHGLSDNLIRRGADVMLKERRPMVFVPREAPFSPIHLRNLLTITETGGIVVPPVLTFYQDPGDHVSAQIDFVVSRILDQLGLENQLYDRWGD